MKDVREYEESWAGYVPPAIRQMQPSAHPLGTDQRRIREGRMTQSNQAMWQFNARMRWREAVER